MRQTTHPQIDRQDARPPTPWRWLGLGALITLIVLVALAWFLGRFLTQPPDETSAALEPTIIVRTAPPVPTATVAVFAPSPTVAPTATTEPTRDLSVAPPEVTVGYYAQVVETGGIGVTVRNGPSTANQPVTVAGENSIILVLEGPTPGGQYQWWRIRLGDGTEGWVAGDFLRPSAAP